MLDGHGDDGYRHGVAIRANFSSNARSDVDLAPLRDHLFRCFDRVASYPEVAAESHARQIAATVGLAPDQVLVTAGATGAIYLIAHAFRQLRLERLDAKVHAANLPAKKLLELLGFMPEGRLKGHVLRDGVRHDVDVFGLLSASKMKNGA